MKNKTDIGVIKHLFISDKTNITRDSHKQIKVDTQGVVGDKFYNKSPKRSILISSISAYDIIKKENISVQYGQLGENILVDFNPYTLTQGTQLQAGDVILEITQECTICKSLNKIGDNVSTLLQNDRGVFAKVITEGILTQNDTLKIIN